MAISQQPVSPQPVHQPAPNRRPRRRKRKIALAVVVALAGIVAWYWRPMHEFGLTAASFGARVACPCRYISGRPLETCKDDFEEGMDLVFLSEDEEARSVTATVPLIASQTATFREGQGCVLEGWRD